LPINNSSCYNQEYIVLDILSALKGGRFLIQRKNYCSFSKGFVADSNNTVCPTAIKIKSFIKKAPLRGKTKRRYMNEVLLFRGEERIKCSKLMNNPQIL
jgi:hypothetical protein